VQPAYLAFMPSRHQELVQRTLGAYLTGDEATLRAMMVPDGEVYGAPGIVNAGTYHGFDGWQQWVRQWEEAWEDANYELLEMIDVGGAFVVVPVRVVGRGAGSGVEVDTVFGWMYEFRDGQVARFHVYPNVDDAVEAAKRLAER
jgi:ketosteroid isomerase-like protein